MANQVSARSTIQNLQSDLCSQARGGKLHATSIEKAAEERARAAIDRLPDEMLLTIFANLELKDLGGVASVCRRWNSLSADNALWDLSKYPFVTILDREVWEKHADIDALQLNVSAETPINNREIVRTARSMIKSGIEDETGVTVLTMPEGLDMDQLKKFGLSPKAGNKARGIAYRDHLGHRTDRSPSTADKVKKTYRIVISNSILRGTRKQSLLNLGERLEAMHCRAPTELEAATLALLTYVSSSPGCLIYRFRKSEENKGEQSYTLCSDDQSIVRKSVATTSNNKPHSFSMLVNKGEYKHGVAAVQVIL